MTTDQCESQDCSELHRAVERIAELEQVLAEKDAEIANLESPPYRIDGIEIDCSTCQNQSNNCCFTCALVLKEEVFRFNAAAKGYSIAAEYWRSLYHEERGKRKANNMQKEMQISEYSRLVDYWTGVVTVKDNQIAQYKQAVIGRDENNKQMQIWVGETGVENEKLKAEIENYQQKLDKVKKALINWHESHCVECDLLYPIHTGDQGYNFACDMEDEGLCWLKDLMILFNMNQTKTVSEIDEESAKNKNENGICNIRGFLYHLRDNCIPINEWDSDIKSCFECMAHGEPCFIPEIINYLNGNNDIASWGKPSPEPSPEKSVPEPEMDTPSPAVTRPRGRGVKKDRETLISRSRFAGFTEVELDAVEGALNHYIRLRGNRSATMDPSSGERKAVDQEIIGGIEAKMSKKIESQLEESLYLECGCGIFHPHDDYPFVSCRKCGYIHSGTIKEIEAARANGTLMKRVHWKDLTPEQQKRLQDQDEAEQRWEEEQELEQEEYEREGW
jgi:hypothetical protein